MSCIVQWCVFVGGGTDYIQADETWSERGSVCGQIKAIPFKMNVWKTAARKHGGNVAWINTPPPH